VDAAGQLAQLDQGVLGVLVRGADQFAGGRDVRDRAGLSQSRSKYTQRGKQDTPE
jgi:hypothetical protein